MTRQQLPVAQVDVVFPSAEVHADLRFCDETDRLTARLAGVGSSDVPILTGANRRYNTPLGLYDSKRSTSIDAADLATSEAAEMGHLFEPVIGEAFAARFGACLLDVPFILRDPERPWRMASPDFALERFDRYSLLEVKVRAHWFDELPQDIFEQVQWQMHITGLDLCHVAVLFSGIKIDHFPVRYDASEGKRLARVVDGFWGQVVLGDPPDPTADDASSMTPTKPQRALDRRLLESARERAVLAQEVSALKDRIDEIDANIRVALSDYEVGVDETGQQVVSYLPSTRRSVPIDALYRMFGAGANHLIRESTSRRLVYRPKALLNPPSSETP